MKRILTLIFYVSLFLIILSLSCVAHVQKKEKEHYKNIIVLIPDGCGVAHMTIARWFKGRPLVQDSMDVSLVKTFSANSMITGSASSATAFACGFKTWEGQNKAYCLSMRPDSLIVPQLYKIPDSEQWRPIATILEGARIMGKAVGLVATSRISHATPAAYACHWHSRYNDNVIMEQLVYQNIDVAFAGGLGYLYDVNTTLPGYSSKGKRKDNENLHDVLISKGYKIITTEQELNQIQASDKKIWGMFAPSHMVHDIDRQILAADQPSLEQMTKKAIDILSQNPQGFFLMVEGSQVDWSSHDNDPVGTITDYIAFDRAVKAALDFAHAHPFEPTLVLVFPDHDNGGMSLGQRNIDSYSLKPEDMNQFIENARMTASGTAGVILSNIDITNPDIDSLQRIITHYYGINDLTSDELEMILDEFTNTRYINLGAVLGPCLSQRANIGWTTYDHTGNDVPMFSYGFNHAPQTIDNTEIAQLCAQAMAFDLDSLNKRLVVEASDLFYDASLEIDTAGVEASMGILLVSRKGKKAIFPFFKNIMVCNKDTVELEGLVLYSLPTNKVFLPEQARSLFINH